MSITPMWNPGLGKENSLENQKKKTVNWTLHDAKENCYLDTGCNRPLIGCALRVRVIMSEFRSESRKDRRCWAITRAIMSELWRTGCNRKFWPKFEIHRSLFLFLFAPLWKLTINGFCRSQWRWTTTRWELRTFNKVMCTDCRSICWSNLVPQWGNLK